MPENNFVLLRGNLAADPHFMDNLNGSAYLRFFLAVPRAASVRPRTAPDGRSPQEIDLVRIIRFGVQAEVDYHYLAKGSAVVVMGWLQSRKYTDWKSARPKVRGQLEVHAQLIVYGRNCNFERGDRKRDDIAERESKDAASLSSDLAGTTSMAMLNQLAAELDTHAD